VRVSVSYSHWKDIRGLEASCYAFFPFRLLSPKKLPDLASTDRILWFYLDTEYPRSIFETSKKEMALTQMLNDKSWLVSEQRHFETVKLRRYFIYHFLIRVDSTT
jgi:hypothetical protein